MRNKSKTNPYTKKKLPKIVSSNTEIHYLNKQVVTNFLTYYNENTMFKL